MTTPGMEDTVRCQSDLLIAQKWQCQEDASDSDGQLDLEQVGFNLWLMTPGSHTSYLACQIFILQFVTVTKSQL